MKHIKKVTPNPSATKQMSGAQVSGTGQPPRTAAGCIPVSGD